MNQTKQSSVVLHSPDYAPISVVIWGIMLLEWHRNYFCFGGNQLEDVGGKALSLIMSRGWKENSKCGLEEFGHWR
jgi:hypothetical protein